MTGRVEAEARAEGTAPVAIVHPEEVARRVQIKLRSHMGDYADVFIEVLRRSGGGVQLTGSFVLSAIEGAPWRPGDLDVFVRPSFDVGLLADELNRIEYPRPHYPWGFRMSLVYLSGARIEWITSGGGDVVATIQREFDLDVCRCGFDGWEVWSSVPAGRRVARINLAVHTCPDRVKKRFLKYTHRGYRVICEAHRASNCVEGEFLCAGCFAFFLAECAGAPVLPPGVDLFLYELTYEKFPLLEGQ